MPQIRDEIRDVDATAECALEKGLAGLEQAAAELGAKTVAVLVVETSALEIAYPRACTIECGVAIRGALSGASGAIPAGTSIACYLTSAIAPIAESFLLFPWRAGRRVVTIVFGFKGPEPGHPSIPDRVVESLNLAALAAWSVKEANRLRGELRVANHQLANRKVVERAKSMLQSERGMTEQEAYECLRKMSRQRRVTLTKLAEDLVGTRSLTAAAQISFSSRAR
jgi:hypothetical protein